MNIVNYFLLIVPLLLSYVFSGETVLSYLLAWGGSFWVFYFALSGNLKPLPTDRSLFEQAMRPIVLPHIIFAGYMATTSIFYFFSEQGYTFFDKDPFYITNWNELELLANCQRYYLAGHCAYVIGIVSFMNYEKPKYILQIGNLPQFTLYFSLILLFISFVVQFIPGLSQIVQIANGVSIVASIMSFALALSEKAFAPKAISGGIFMANYVAALTSGWKEAIIVPLVLLGTYMYSKHKTAITILTPLFIAFYFTYVPAYNAIVRAEAWNENGELKGLDLVQYAIVEINADHINIKETNWGFLTGRLSEIGMFTKYAEAIPERLDFYHFTIVRQGLENVMPRVFYPEKPMTEKLVMERVIAAGVVSEISTVSAKPAYIIDCYLSYGFIGIVLGCFLLGAYLSFVSVKAESLFGGYAFGSGLFFTGIFLQLWRGNCFEFVTNNAVWGYVFLLVFFEVFKSLKILAPKTENL